ncbi:MAG: hypothetical protein H7A38_01080 [Chlamydiales bacterium]|nr:hypothetical protein [Chlamydiales bacterium]
MRRFLSILVFIALGFLIGFGFREVQGEIQAKREAKKRQVSYSTEPVMEEKPFVVLMFEEEMGVEERLLSVLNQDYEPFRVIYIGEGREKGKRFLQNYDHDGKVTYVERKKGIAESELLYRAIHACRNQEVMVLLKQGETFAHSQVLSTINKHFANPNVWMATCQEIKTSTYEKRWNEGSYQTFYIGLAKQIKLEDFLAEGMFSDKNLEKRFFPSLLELAGNHSYGIEDPLIFSSSEPKEIDRRRSYSYFPLKDYPWHDFSKDEERVDLLVFSYNRPLQLYAFLESSEKFLEGLHRQYVIYRAGNDHYEKGYVKVKEAFPNVIYLRQSVENPSDDFAPVVKKILFDRNVSSARYVTFAFDDFLIKESIDFSEAVNLLKETGAHGFYFCLGNHLTDHPEKQKLLIQEGVFGWQFSTMEGEWRTPHSLKMTLFKKEEIEPDFTNMKFHSPNILEALWNEGANLSSVGLYYDKSKAVSLPLNIAMENEGASEKVSKISTKQLLTYFDQGLKIDISRLEEIENETIDVSFIPEFVHR